MSVLMHGVVCSVRALFLLFGLAGTHRDMVTSCWSRSVQILILLCYGQKACMFVWSFAGAQLIVQMC